MRRVAPRLAAAATPHADALPRQLRALAGRIPAAGVSGAQLQAIVDDWVPLLVPAQHGASSLRQLLEAHPQLFRVTPGPAGGEWRVAAAAASESPALAEAVYAVRQECLAQRRRADTRSSFAALEDVMRRAGVRDAAVLDHLPALAPDLETRACVRVRPRRPPRRAVLFIDGDELPAGGVDDMCDALHLIKPRCAVTIVRRAASEPLSAADVVVPDSVPTCVYVERQARALRLRAPHTREDVVYMCSARLFTTYARTVARQNDFPDADVYVCCPSRALLVSPKRLAPF